LIIVTSFWKLGICSLLKFNYFITDLTEVTKQKDMSGFYRYLYKAKMSNEPVDKTSDAIGNKEKDKKPEDVSCKSPHDENASVREQSPVREKSPKHSSEKHYASTRPKRSRHDSDERKNRHDSDEKRNRYDSDERSSSRRRHDSRESRSHGKSRYHDHRDRSDRSRKDDKSRSSTRKTSENDSSSSKSARDAKLKIIQKENWYDFDVEIERDVNKNFYAKRTVGKAFEEALQKYLLRKGPDQVLDPNTKYK